MFKLLLISVVIVPVFLGMLVASRVGARRGLPALIALFLAYDIGFLFMLYYLRLRWVG